mgnify:CR=1 FL=1
MSLKKILVCLDADPQPSVFDGVVEVLRTELTAAGFAV